MGINSKGSVFITIFINPIDTFMSSLYTNYYTSPVGVLEISATDTAVCGLMFRDAETKPSSHLEETEANAIILQCIQELDEYFSGARKVFEVPHK